METESWIPLTDYSNKYRVSISTLRRRIKNENIYFRFHDGKYLLIDQPLDGHQKNHRPSQTSEEKMMALSSAPAQTQTISRPYSKASSPVVQKVTPDLQQENPIISSVVETNRLENEVLSNGPLLSAANRLLSELKKAYSQVLQEKEEQIIQLKEEISDLKTLVKVLEAEHYRKKINN